MSERTQFDYLLNALEFAAQAENPAKADYGGARKRLFAHVRELERKAALYDSLTPCGVFTEENGRYQQMDPSYADRADAVELYRKESGNG